MSSLRSFSAVLAAILVLPGLVAGGAFATCLHVDPAPHQCGAMGIQCDELGGIHPSGGAQDDAVQQGHDCSCSHAPVLPADPATVVSTARLSETAAPLAIVPSVELVAFRTHESVFSAEAHGPPAGTPPVFLLDCALLI